MIAIGLAIVAGLLSAALLVGISRGLKADRWLYAASLPLLPLIYAGFALWVDLPAVALLELKAGLPYLAGGVLLAFAGLRHPRPVMAVVGALWLLHGGYDLLHPRFFDNPGVPVWYPPYCAAVDVALGGTLLVLAAGRRGSLSRRSPHGTA